MSGKKMTFEDLARILREVAGESEDVDAQGDIVDVEFADLGYDSIALLDTGGRIEREYGVRLDDETVSSAKTPRVFLAAVNESLAKVD